MRTEIYAQRVYNLISKQLWPREGDTAHEFTDVERAYLQGIVAALGAMLEKDGFEL